MISKLRYLISLFFTIGFLYSANAQVETKIVGQEKAEMKHELAAGVNMHTNGGLIGGVNFKYQIKYSERLYHYFNLEFANIKHKKEERFASFNGSSFILGKLNYLISIRPQFGQQIVLFNKYPEDGVRLNAVVAGGPTLGIIKPYFIKYQQDSLLQVVAYDPAIHRSSRIAGSGGFFNGFNQATTEIGFNAKLGLDLEFGNYESTLTGIESGWIFEFFFDDIPLYPSAQQTQFFNALYLTFYFGSRY